MTPNGGIVLPPGTQTSTIWIDESGSKAKGANDPFAVGAVKCRYPGLLARSIKAVRDRHSYELELKFSTVTKASAAVYRDLITVLDEADVRLAATVVQPNVFDPFRSERPTWKVHAEITAQLLVGFIKPRELVSVMMDAISTPQGDSLEESVRQRVNRRLGGSPVISAVCLDSKSTDLLQVADLVASAILHQRRQTLGLSPYKDNLKDQVARRLALAFDRPGFEDGKSTRLNIDTYRSDGRSRRRRARAPLRVVDKGRTAG